MPVGPQTDLAPGYDYRPMAERPYVFVNMAMTADGKIDTVERQGARISGTHDSRRVDQLRAGSDAVMVGGRTLLAEDPGLTVRDPDLVASRERDGRPSQPMKVGVASRLAAPGDGSLAPDGDFLGAGGGRVVLCTSRLTDDPAITALERHGAEVLVAGKRRVDLGAALAHLAGLGVGRLMVEGGSTLVAALLAGDLVDELQLAVAPLIFGGTTAPTPVGGQGWSSANARHLSLQETSTDPDGDVILRYLVVGAGA
jgi:2,5-diamino-6-(ribosylamino)-4(3H)-pyrimidinone 5'-phosphate reductase